MRKSYRMREIPQIQSITSLVPCRIRKSLQLEGIIVKWKSRLGLRDSENEEIHAE